MAHTQVNIPRRSRKQMYMSYRRMIIKGGGGKGTVIDDQHVIFYHLNAIFNAIFI